MTREPTPLPGPSPARDRRPTDERYRELGHQITMRFLAVVRVARAYQAVNKVLHDQVVTFLETLRPVLEESGEAVLVVLQTDLYLNGVRIPSKPSAHEQYKTAVEEFERRKIAGLKIERYVTPEEIERFFVLFMQPGVHSGADLHDAAIAAGCHRIRPALSVSTVGPGPEAMGPAPAEPGAAPGPTPRETRAGPAEERGADSDDDPIWGGKLQREDSYREQWARGGDGRARGGEHRARGGDGRVRAGGRPELYGDDWARAEGGRQRDGDASAAGAAEPGPGATPGPLPERFRAALAAARALLTSSALQEGMEMRHARRVVQPLVDGAFASEPVVVGFPRTGHGDQYAWVHSVNVCLVAVAMGRVLGMGRRALADLGVAALLHDLGKNAVADRVRHRLEAFDGADRAAAELHPVEGARLLARSTTLNATTVACMRVALEHHMAVGGSGYPRAADWAPSAVSELISVADCYVSLQTHRSDRGRHVTPYQALGMMLGAYAYRLDPALLWTLVQAVGFYPPGQMVELSDGTLARVLARDPEDLARPHVSVIRDASGASMADRAVEHRPLPGCLSVRRALRAEEYPEPPATGAEAGRAA